VDLIPYLDADFIDRNQKSFIGYGTNIFLDHFLLSSVELVSYYRYTFLRRLRGVGRPFCGNA
jgi:muramoyltetrapeptide carboxypeptidase LdcA involved in peptidoglycan recycling